MKFIQVGPVISPELVAAQEKGQTIFVCGAGVSRHVGLPSFRGLVEAVYRELREDWNLHIAERAGMVCGGALEGQYDRVLRCLERRLAASDLPRNRGMRERIRAAVRHALRAPDGVDLTNHLALLELSRDEEGRSRLLTTNFDTLFERAWLERHGVPTASHAGTAMPQPKVAGCTGVLHLHGRLADTHPTLNLAETDLVLTSAEFGDAYLRSGWASRYVYDLVRAYVVVLVGYQADDPPMRYLLEVLEADRARYSDLREVFAFASCAPGEEDVTRALWLAKGVEPILYTAVHGDHSPLYRTLAEWRRYADDPTAWRRERLCVLFADKPDALGEAAMQECADLLGHGDASQLLGELSPAAEWLPALSSKRVFSASDTHVGLWAASRINDPEMIRQCAALGPFDDQMRWHLQRPLDDDKVELTPLRREAWNLMLSVPHHQQPDFDDSWYRHVKRIKQGKTGHQVRRLVTRILRPRFAVKKRLLWYRHDSASTAPETLRDLINIEFEPAKHPSPEEMLAAWPKGIEEEIRLFRMLERALAEALEEADEVGFLAGLDRAGYDVPSVAPHAQNAYHSGFYPITGTIADLWARIVEQDPARARSLAAPWAGSSFNLMQRLYLYALAHSAYSAQEVAATLRGLDDGTFWSGHAQVEVMRLLVARWNALETADREALEARLRTGIPRALFPDDAFEKAEEWGSIVDSSIHRRLKRIQAAGGQLAPESVAALAAISARHPKWGLSPGERDDFSFWHESGRGPDGEPNLLARVDDESLVREAMRIQREQQYEQGDLWRLFCSADPDRALRGLKHEAANGEWNAGAWRSLIWAACDKGTDDFQFELADLLLRMPEGPLVELLDSITSWLQKRRAILAASDREGGSRFLPLWDRFADLAYDRQDDNTERDDDDLDSASLSEPGGMLAWIMLDTLREPKPQRGSGIGPDLAPRFDRIAETNNRAGLLGRYHLARDLAYIDAIDPAWAMQNLAPRLQWSHPESLAMWRSYAHGRIGSPTLFNALKPALLAAFERRDLEEDQFEGVMDRLLRVGVSHKRNEARDYDLSSAEIRRALTMGPSSVRQNASRIFWRMAAEADGEPPDHAERWRTVIGPLFREVWPLDAGLRSERISHNLVLMALECGAAFPEAVESIVDLLVPYHFYRLAHSLRLEAHHEKLVLEHPIALVRLVNAVIDPAKHPVPEDLATLLEECAAANPTVVNEPAYVRLFGLQRGRGA